MKKYEWQMVKAESKELTFWLVDYYNVEEMNKRVNALPLDPHFSFMNYTINDLRNNDYIKTAYFDKEQKALDFVDELVKGVDKIVFNTTV